MSVIEQEMGDFYAANNLESSPTVASLLATLARVHKSLDWISRYSSETDVRSEARDALRSIER